jgi:hypothetical protein
MDERRGAIAKVGEQWSERRMQAEEAVEVERGAIFRARARPRHGDRRTGVVVDLLAVRDEHVQAVDGAALEDGDENPPRGSGGKRARARHANEDVGQEASGDEREART